MRVSPVIQFQSSAVASLLRPWKKYKDGTLFYGLTKSGSKRHPMTTKQGNRFNYKGTRSSGIGRFTSHGRYIINWDKVRTYVVPPTLKDTTLTPFVSSNSPELRHDYSGYNGGPQDPVLYLDQLRNYVEYGTNGKEQNLEAQEFVEKYTNPRLDTVHKSEVVQAESTEKK